MSFFEIAWSSDRVVSLEAHCIFCCYVSHGFTVVWDCTAHFCEKIRVFQADVYLNSSAWNNRIGEIALLLVLG